MILSVIIKRSISEPHCPLGSLDIRPVSFQSQMFFWAHLGGAGWSAACGAQTPHSSGRGFRPVRSLPLMGPCHHRWGFWWDHVSASAACLSVALLPLVVDGAVQLVVSSFSAWIIPLGSCRFDVFVGGGEFMVFLWCQLGLPPTGFVWDLKLMGCVFQRKKNYLVCIILEII